MIHIKNARCHNLKNITVSFPDKKVIVVTGLSGSGKSSLVFDTLYAEAQRRFLESLSHMSKNYLHYFEKPDVERITGLTPAIAIASGASVHNPRSTVGTITEVYDYVRLLFLRSGERTCVACKAKKIKGAKNSCATCGASLPELELRFFSFNSPFGACRTCQGLGIKQEIDKDLVMPNKKLSIAEGGIKPLVSSVMSKSAFWNLCMKMLSAERISSSAPLSDLSEKALHKILFGVPETKYPVKANGIMNEKSFEGVIPFLEKRYAETDSSFVRLEIERYMRNDTCPECGGTRLHEGARTVEVQGVPLASFVQMNFEDIILLLSRPFFQKETVSQIAYEITSRLVLLQRAGMGYVTLNRATNTLSNGELQRIRLATQVGSGLSGVTYMLDEPSLGLHARDVVSLIEMLMDLKSLGNTVIVVEHDRDIIKAADYVIDMGPGAGKYGGKIVAQGTPSQLKASQGVSQTARFLTGAEMVLKRVEFRKPRKKKIVIHGAQEHNLKNITVTIPLGIFICVTGVSGSGKSTLIYDILARALAQKMYRAKTPPGKHMEIEGIEHVNKVIRVDQSPIGRTPRSNPATYTGLFTPIRDFYAQLPESVSYQYTKGQFSFNVKKGRCSTCSGDGEVKIEMYFLPDVYVKCPDCKGKRYNPRTLQIRWKQRSIADVLEMSVDEALRALRDLPKACRILKTLHDVGLGYMPLGQPATTLSGGEAQRVKLASELSRAQTGNTLYILDEPTVGLHFGDVKQLLTVLHALTDKGNTVIVIEHNIDVIKSCDYVIDMGPEGGDRGGEVIAVGSPDQIAMNKRSYTGRFL